MKTQNPYFQLNFRFNPQWRGARFNEAKEQDKTLMPLSVFELCMAQ